MRSFILVILSVLLSSQAQSQVQNSASSASVFQASPVTIMMGWPFLQSEIARMGWSTPQQWSGAWADQTVNVAGLQVHLAGLQLSAISTPSAVTIANGEFVMNAPQIQVQAFIQQIWIDQAVHQNLGGVNINMQVKVQCSPVALTQPQASLFSTLHFTSNGTTATPAFDSFSLQWPAGSWSVGAFSCQGPQGVTEAIRTQIQASLSSGAAFAATVESLISAQISQKLATMVAPYFSVQRFAGSVNDLRLTSMDIRPQGLFLNGWMFANEQSLDGIFFQPQVTPSVLVSLSPRLAQNQINVLLAQDDLAALAQNQFFGPMGWWSYDMRKNSSADSLLSSRLLQFFIWPELFNFSTHASYTLQVQRPATIKTLWIGQETTQSSAMESNQESSQGNNQGSNQASATRLQWSGVTRAVLQAPRDKYLWNLAEMTVAASGTLTVNLASGVVAAAGKGRLGKFSMSYGHDYVSRYYPSGGLPASTFSSAIKSGLKNISLTVTFPDLNFGAFGTYSASGISALPSGYIGIGAPLK